MNYSIMKSFALSVVRSGAFSRARLDALRGEVEEVLISLIDQLAGSGFALRRPGQGKNHAIGPNLSELHRLYAHT